MTRRSPIPAILWHLGLTGFFAFCCFAAAASAGLSFGASVLALALGAAGGFSLATFSWWVD